MKTYEFRRVFFRGNLRNWVHSDTITFENDHNASDWAERINLNKDVDYTILEVKEIESGNTVYTFT